jgi:hypothetical protein
MIVAEVWRSFRAKHFVDILASGHRAATVWGPAVRVTFHNIGGRKWWTLTPKEGPTDFAIHVDRIVRRP